MFTRSTITPGIFLLRFPSQYALASTFLRIQEHYESSRFSGRVFTLEQYMDWYASRFGTFSYFTDWTGFNVPSTALQPFYDGEFNPLMAKEQRLLRAFRHERAPFYVIGVFGDGAGGTLTHEIAHALYFTNAQYRAAVTAAMRGVDTSGLRRQLAAMGYARHVLTDEVQAYLVAPSGTLGASNALAPLRKKLRALFKQHDPRLNR